MPTKKPRVVVTFDVSSAEMLEHLAKLHQQSLSNFAKHLILDALDRQEDQILSHIADAQIVDGVVSHEKAWS